MTKQYDKALKAYHDADEVWEKSMDVGADIRRMISTLNQATAFITNAKLIAALEKEVAGFRKCLAKSDTNTKRCRKLQIIADVKLSDVQRSERFYSSYPKLYRYEESYEHDFWCNVCKFRKKLKCNNPDSTFYKKSIKSLVMVNPRQECYVHPED